jgi:hypothetical protein
MKHLLIIAATVLGMACTSGQSGGGGAGGSGAGAASRPGAGAPATGGSGSSSGGLILPGGSGPEMPDGVRRPGETGTAGDQPMRHPGPGQMAPPTLAAPTPGRGRGVGGEHLSR